VCAGGSKRSEGMSSFSEGFAWANFDLGLTLPGRNESAQVQADRRRRDPYRRSKSGGKQQDAAFSDSAGKSSHVQEDGNGSCEASQILPPVEILLTCGGVLLIVTAARQLLALVFTRYLQKEQPPTLLFPAWEVDLFTAKV
jgi:hypothetical protein